MERNEALLRKVGDVIANEPERYDQGCLVRKESCGTVACIAGHTLLLNDMIYESGRPDPKAPLPGDILGLEPDECRIFHPDWQPAGDPSVPLHERVQAALYALADGASVEEVSASG